MSYHLFVPAVMTPTTPELGAQIEGAVYPLREWVVPGRCYQIPISWRDFSERMSEYDGNARQLYGCPLSLGIKQVPVRYRLWPEWVSSPPSPDAYPALAEFIKLLLHRYQPARLELFNEPNVGQQEAQDYQEFFGAWIGQGEAAHIAGARYGAMLRAVYPLVKIYYPTVQVYAGALMRNWCMLDFIDGMGDAPADCLSYHHYLAMGAPFAGLDAMVSELQQHTALPIAISETSVLADETSPEHAQRKADWLSYLIENRERLGIRSVMWYTAAGNGWRNSDLAPGPAWNVFAEK